MKKKFRKQIRDNMAFVTAVLEKVGKRTMNKEDKMDLSNAHVVVKGLAAQLGKL